MKVFFKWQRWFAWFPVLVGERFVWLRQVGFRRGCEYKEGPFGTTILPGQTFIEFREVK